MGDMAAIQLGAPGLGEAVGHGLRESHSYISNKIASSNQLEDRYKWLDHALKMLLAMKDDNDKQVQRNKQKDTTSIYNLWTNRVSEVAAEIDTLRNKYGGERIPKWRIWKRSSLSEKMLKGVSDILQLQKEVPRDFLVDKMPEVVIKELHVPQIVDYPTLQGCLESILDLLRNSKTQAIGVCGTKGVGKTTIVRNLNNSEEVAKLFDIIIFVREGAAQTDHNKLQQTIAKRLMVDKEALKDPDEVARRIHEELENKKYLLILDEIVDFINLKQLGIPINNNGCKVVIATQFPHVCKLNKVQRLVKVTQLSSDEAWKMFRSIVMPVIDFPDVQQIARIVCNRCSRLPLLINMIASSFKLKESASSWRAGLEDLKPWPELQYQGLEELYSFLTNCYDELKDENKQKCFLYTSLYPADDKVYNDYLVECWAAQGFLGDINETRRYRKARDQGNAILEHLINVSLLEKGEGIKYVKMNDCIRQLALHISSKHPECSFYVESDEELKESSKPKAWLQTRWVSMISKKLHDLPTNQDCNMLLTLLLQKNSELVTFPQAFFENMSNLTLLDLYGTRIKQLPQSLSKLINLKALYLNDCALLMMLPSAIGSLQNLTVLDIRGSGVYFMPIHLKYLASLKCLRISYISGGNQCREEYVETVHNVMLELYKLEELIIEVISYMQWCNDAEHVIQQVASFDNLSIFRCSFPSSSILQQFLETSRCWRDSKQLTSFRFFIGCKNSKCHWIIESFPYRINSYLKYCNGEEKDDLATSEVLPRTDAFELVGHKDIKSLSGWVQTTTLNRIRGIVIERCNKMSTVVAGDMDDNTMNGNGASESILPNLEQLYLDNLLNLKWAFRGPLHPGTLSKLQSLTLKNCPMLRKIFFKLAIQDFSQLRKLTVQDCSGIEELVNVSEKEKEGFALPKLEMLILDGLPNLNSLCKYDILAWPSLVCIQIHRCPKLKTLPFGMDDAANLRSIKGEKEWWNSLVWTNNNKDRFQSMFVALCN